LSSGLVDKILSEDLLSELLAEYKKRGRSDRGSAQKYAGYATMNQQFDDIHSITAPQIIASPRTSVQRMVDFTSLIKLFCAQFHLSQPYSDDSARTKDWAQRLCDELELHGINLIEQCTFALTCLDTEEGQEPMLFGSHVDHLNDPQWPEVFCIYKHFFFEGRLYRLAAIAYSRSIIRQYLFKDFAYDCLKKKMIDYLRSPSNSNRMNISLEVCVPLDEKLFTAEDNIKYRKCTPFLDKAGFYSGFVHAILQVWDGVSLERLCELIILVGWIPTATTFMKILTEWKERKTLPTGNWTLAYIEDAISGYGGITNGPGHRCQPWMNRPLLHGSIVDGLVILRDVFLQCGKEETNDENAMPYVTLMNRLKMIVGVGPLGAQHIIGVASLMCALPAHYQSFAMIGETTFTAKKVRKFYHLSAIVLDKQKFEIAEITGLDEKFVESGYCEMFREEPNLAVGDTPVMSFDEDSHAIVMEERTVKPQHPDVYFHGQSLRTVKNGKLHEMYRDSSDVCCIRYIPYIALLGKPPVSTDWWSAKGISKNVAARVINTSRKHEEACSKALGLKEKPRLQTRSKIKHSGFGIHHGLEKRLKECK
jgi:hypothetical protein